MSQRFKIWICAALALVLAQAIVSLLFPQNFRLIAWSDITQFLLLLSGTLALIPNILATRGKTRLFWLMMALGVASWFCYQGFWTYIEIFLKSEVPNPFVGDVVLVLHIVPMMAALAFQPHVEQDERTVRFSSLDFTLLLVWWLYLYVVAVIPWQYVSLNEVSIQLQLECGVPGRKNRIFVGFGSGLDPQQRTLEDNLPALVRRQFTYASSSYLANWAIQRHVYYSGSLYDLPLALSMAWVTIVGIVALRLSPKQQPARNSNGHGVWVARLGMGTMASLPLFAAWSVFNTAAPAKRADIPPGSDSLLHADYGRNGFHEAAFA